MRNILISLLALLLCQGSYAEQKNNKIHQYTLNNGMKVIIKEDHRAPVVVSMVWYKVGSADEPGGITGVSHALEHMMFKGTKQFPAGVFSKTIAQNGGQENAFTNYDYTAYFEKLSADRLPIAFKLESDRMRNLILSEKEFEKEIEVIKEERRMRTDDNPQSLTFERFLAAAHLASPYQHPVIGWMNDLDNMSIGDLKKWYSHYYAPNNTTLVVVGDVNPEKTYQLAKQYFGSIKPQPIAKNKPHREPRPLGKKLVNITAPAKLPFVMLGYSVPSVNTADKTWQPYALEIIAGILDNGENARFAKQLIRGQHVASYADIYFNLYARYDTQFIVYGIPSQNNTVKQLENALISQVNDLKTTKVDEKELNRVRNQIIAEKVFQKDSQFGQAMELGLLETVGQKYTEADNYIKKVNAITPEQIQQVAKDYFINKRLTVAILTPEEKKS